MTQTIERTGKKWKAIQLLAAMLLALGVGLFMAAGPLAFSHYVGIVVFMVGLLTWLVGSIGAWWYHE